MTLSGDRIEYRFTQAEVARELKAMRKLGLRSPRDHLVKEIVRACLVVLPLVLVASQMLAIETYFAYLIGYFAVRLFDNRIKPVLLSRVGPKELRRESRDTQVIVTLGPDGVRTKSETTEGHIRWAVISVTRVGAGFVRRIGHELSIALPDTLTPEDWSVDEVKDAMSLWSGQSFK